jgi:hypothetical protein
MKKPRKSQFDYKGKLEDYQIQMQGQTAYQSKMQKESKYQPLSYSPYQNRLYKRALYGLDALKKEELTTICKKKKHRISRVYYKGQVAINLYKQKITNAYSNQAINKFFLPDSPIAKFFTENSEVDDEYINTLTFEDLGIHKDQIIRIFIDNGVLPKNFLDLKKDPNQLPRLKNASKKENM